MSHVPTPGEFADMLVEQHVHVHGELLPLSEAKAVAKRRLVLMAVQETYGDDHPIGKLARSLHRLEKATLLVNRHQYTSEFVHDELEQIQELWEDISKMFLEEL